MHDFLNIHRKKAKENSRKISSFADETFAVPTGIRLGYSPPCTPYSDAPDHKTFVALKVKDELRLELYRRGRLGINTFGSTNVDEKMRDVVRMQLESVEGKKAGTIEAYVVENISEINNEHVKVIKKDFKHLNKLWLSDVCRSKEVL